MTSNWRPWTGCISSTMTVPTKPWMISPPHTQRRSTTIDTTSLTQRQHDYKPSPRTRRAGSLAELAGDGTHSLRLSTLAVHFPKITLLDLKLLFSEELFSG